MLKKIPIASQINALCVIIFDAFVQKWMWSEYSVVTGVRGFSSVAALVKINLDRMEHKTTVILRNSHTAV